VYGIEGSLTGDDELRAAGGGEEGCAATARAEPERDRDAPAVGRRLLPVAAPCSGPHSEVGEQDSSPHPVEHTHASAAAATISPRCPPAKFA